jgi:Spy/CpxP family protein refolding chaperone
MRKTRRLTAILLAGAFALSVPASVASAAADKFGPGNGGGGGAQKCHPPGQTTDTPGCK